MKIKQNLIPLFAIVAANVVAPIAQAQFAIDWFTLDGGGGTSTGGPYAISGTIGQPEAGWPVDQNGFAVPSTGGSYTLVGGFWSVIQTPGAPRLQIERNLGSATLNLSWPLTSGGWTLEQATSLSAVPVNWTPTALPYQTNVPRVSVTLPAPAGNRYFRLRQP